jgi:hypothetical protein
VTYIRGIPTLAEDWTWSSSYFKKKALGKIFCYYTYSNMREVPSMWATVFCSAVNPYMQNAKLNRIPQRPLQFVFQLVLEIKTWTSATKETRSEIFNSESKKEMKFWFPNVTSALTHFSSATIDISNVFCGEVIGMTRNRRIRKRLQKERVGRKRRITWNMIYECKTGLTIFMWHGLLKAFPLLPWRRA